VRREDLIEHAAAAASAAAATACAALALSWWLRLDPTAHLASRLPVTAPEFATLSSPDPRQTGAVDLRGGYRAGTGRPGPEAGSWPRFRGADFSNTSREAVRLAEAWPQGGPPVLWAADLGEGHGGAAVHRGRVYLLDYDEPSESDVLRCLSLTDGSEIWRRWYRTGAKRNHGISRTVPAVSDRWVVTIGPRCHVLCAGAEGGEFLWGIDLAREYGTAEPLWYTAQHPLIDGDTVVIAPGGRALMIGVDAATGRVLWETPNPRGWKMSHASVVPLTLAGRRVYVYAALGGIVGVAADGPDAGALVWETDEWNHSVVAPSPVALDGERFLVTAGYGVGSAVFRVAAAGGALKATLERRFERTEFAAEQQTPLVAAGLVCTVMPKDGGALREQFVCMGADGGLRWGSGKDARFGLGPFLAADGKLFILADDGTLTLARASATAFEPLARAKVLAGVDAWAPMAIAGGRLLLRDSRRMLCLDVREGAAAAAGTAARAGGVGNARL
jgi:outer membrane protein assembly factor BamB